MLCDPTSDELFHINERISRLQNPRIFENSFNVLQGVHLHICAQPRGQDYAQCAWHIG